MLGGGQELRPLTVSRALFLVYWVFVLTVFQFCRSISVRLAMQRNGECPSLSPCLINARWLQKIPVIDN